MTNKIAIFGFKDSSAGQLFNFLPQDIKQKVDCFISVGEKIDIDIKEEHNKRPNTKTSFIENDRINGLPVFFTKDITKILSDRNIDAVYIIEDTGKLREQVYNIVSALKIKILNFIHESVLLAGKNTIGEGAIIFPKNYIAYKTDIGKCCYLEPNNNIEHHNVVEDYCNILGNVATGGFTKISKYTQINMHVDIIDKITIGKESIIGTGSLVLGSIGDNQLWYGRPAKYIRNC